MPQDMDQVNNVLLALNVIWYAMNVKFFYFFITYYLVGIFISQVHLLRLLYPIQQHTTPVITDNSKKRPPTKKFYIHLCFRMLNRRNLPCFSNNSYKFATLIL
jgi:hypothetical protein